MANGRMLQRSIAHDGRLASLTVESELFYLKTIPFLDRDGLVLGSPQALWGTVVPRRETLLSLAPAIIASWVAVGLVIAYPTLDGPALFFHGFRQNQPNLRYHREPASAIAPPPGFSRDADGLALSDPQALSSLISAGISPELYRQLAGNAPDDSHQNGGLIKGKLREDNTLLTGADGAVILPENNRQTSGTAPVSLGGDFASVSAGKSLAERMQAFNGILAPTIRRPMVDELLRITGLENLANTDGANGQLMLEDAHRSACTHFKMWGAKTPEQLIELETAFYAQDTRRARPSLLAFEKFASVTHASGERNGSHAVARPGAGRRVSPAQNRPADTAAANARARAKLEQRQAGV